jgi:hypothetical protein
VHLLSGAIRATVCKGKTRAAQPTAAKRDLRLRCDGFVHFAVIGCERKCMLHTLVRCGVSARLQCADVFREGMRL